MECRKKGSRSQVMMKMINMSKTASSQVSCCLLPQGGSLLLMLESGERD